MTNPATVTDELVAIRHDDVEINVGRRVFRVIQVQHGDAINDSHAHGGDVLVRERARHEVESRFARLNPVQAHILELLGLPQPAELCAQPVRV